MNKIYSLVFNRALGIIQIAPETARSKVKGSSRQGTSIKIGQSPLQEFKVGKLVAAIAFALGSIALPATAANVIGADGAPGANSPFPFFPATAGGNGSDAVSNTSSTFNNIDIISGGAGGIGGNGSTGFSGSTGSANYSNYGRAGAGGNGKYGSSGANGGFGGVGVSGNYFNLTNSGTIAGGTGGTGGAGGAGGTGGTGGSNYATYGYAGAGGNGGNGASGVTGNNGGAGVYGSYSTLMNSGNISGGVGGAGGAGGSGGNGGSAGSTVYYSGRSGYGGAGGSGSNGGIGGAGVSGYAFDLTNDSSITGGAGGAGGQGGNGGNVANGYRYSTSGGSAGFGGTGGNGGNGIHASSSTISNNGIVTGGIGGQAGNGGNGGYGGYGFASAGVGGNAGSGGAGGVGIFADNSIINNSGDITGGNGGQAGNGGAGGSQYYTYFTSAAGGAGGSGGNAGAGISGTGFSLTNIGNILGGNGGTGGVGGNGGSQYFQGGTGGNGGTGGAGGAGVSGFGFTLTNTGNIAGGNGGAGGIGGSGGNGNGYNQPNGTNGTAGSIGLGGAGVVSTGNSIIDNAGTISGGFDGTGNIRANAITLSGGGNKIVIESASIINGNVVSGGGDTLALGGSLASSFDISTIGNVSDPVQYQGFTNFAKEGASVWTLTGTGAVTQDWAVNAGTLNLDNVSFTGSANVLSGATLHMSPGISTITGSLTQNAGSFFQTDVASNSNYGQLQLSSTATLNGAAIVNVIGAPVLTSGGTLTGVIHAAGGVSGTFATISDNSALFDFTPIYTSNDFSLGIVAANSTPSGNSTGVLDAVLAAGNSSGVGAAIVFDNLITSGGVGPMSPVITALGSLQTGQQVSDAVSQTLPLLVGGTHAVLADTLRNVGHIVESRQDANRGLASGDAFLTNRMVWFKPFGSWADQDDRNGASGYSAKTGGLILGVDTEVSNNSRLGAAFVYSDSNIDGNSSVASNKADLKNYQIVGYGSTDFSESTYMNYQVDFGHFNVQGNRQIPFAGTRAKSDYNGMSAHAGLGLNHIFDMDEKTTFIPSIRADYTWIREKSYSEKDAGPLNLNVKGESTEEFIISVDGKIIRKLNDSINLAGNLGAGYDLINSQNSITSAFAGTPTASFVTKGIDPSPWMLRGGLGVTKTTPAGIQVSVRYDMEVRKDFDNQTASLNVKIPF